MKGMSRQAKEKAGKAAGAAAAPAPKREPAGAALELPSAGDDAVAAAGAGAGEAPAQFPDSDDGELAGLLQEYDLQPLPRRDRSAGEPSRDERHRRKVLKRADILARRVLELERDSRAMQLLHTRVQAEAAAAKAASAALGHLVGILGLRWDSAGAHQPGGGNDAVDGGNDAAGGVDAPEPPTRELVLRL
jgi:hypothetical protein